MPNMSAALLQEPKPADPATAVRGAHHCPARSEVAFHLHEELDLGPGNDAGFDETGSEDVLFSTFMDIEKISSSPPP
ncbi:hypothetical protein ABZP36_027098 [Zizania latifolia]